MSQEPDKENRFEGESLQQHQMEKLKWEVRRLRVRVLVLILLGIVTTLEVLGHL